MNKIYSSRDIEKACKRNINFMFLLEDSKTPDHSTIERFRSIHLAACVTDIFNQFVKFLYDINEISGDSIFIDGTKIEVNANKYTFVWKKSVDKYLNELLTKIADLVSECETLYGIQVGFNHTVQLKDIKKLRKKLYTLKKSGGITFVHGCSKRKSQ